MTENKRKVSMAQHVAETHGNKIRKAAAGTVVTGDIVSGVVDKDGDADATSKDNQGKDS